METTGERSGGVRRRSLGLVRKQRRASRPGRCFGCKLRVRSQTATECTRDGVVDAAGWRSWSCRGKKCGLQMDGRGRRMSLALARSHSSHTFRIPAIKRQHSSNHFRARSALWPHETCNSVESAAYAQSGPQSLSHPRSRTESGKRSSSPVISGIKKNRGRIFIGSLRKIRQRR